MRDRLNDANVVATLAHTVRGKQVKERSLGKERRAARADTAGSAASATSAASARSAGTAATAAGGVVVDWPAFGVRVSSAYLGGCPAGRLAVRFSNTSPSTGSAIRRPHRRLQRHHHLDGAVIRPGTTRTPWFLCERFGLGQMGCLGTRSEP